MKSCDIIMIDLKGGFYNHMKNKRGVTSGLMVTLIIGVVILIAIVGFLAFTQFQATQPPEPGEVVVQPTLLGKGSVLSINARDQAPDDKTTRRSVPVYIQDPDEIFTASGGTSTSTTQAQDFTSGIFVSELPYKVAAFNNTYGSVDGLVDVVIERQAKTVDLNVYTIARSLEITFFDTNDVALPTFNGTNLTLAGGQTDDFTKVKIKNNDTDTMYRLFGIYVDLIENTNVSTANFNDARVSDEGTMSLSRTSADDLTFGLVAPILMAEFDSVELDSLAVTADGDGCIGTLTERWVWNFVDGEYYFSAQGEGVKFGPENDATSPADVGAPDYTSQGYCLA